MRKEVSVIIPNYNGANFIRRAVESVLNQTVTQKEIIIVDNLSSDNSLNKIADYLDRLTILHCRKPGASAARNLGVSQSNSSLIAFLDNDDEWHENHLATLLQEDLDSNQIRGSLARYTTRKRTWGTSIQSASNQEAAVNFVKKGKMPIMTSSWLLHRDWFDYLGGFDEVYSLGQDFEFMHRHFLADGTIDVKRTITLNYYLGSWSETSKSHKQQYLTARYIRSPFYLAGVPSLKEFLDTKPKLILNLNSWTVTNYRKAVFDYEEKKYAKSLIRLILTLVLNPIDFFYKIKNQLNIFGKY